MTHNKLFEDGTPNRFGLWGRGQNGRHEFSMYHISANNKDRKLICVSLILLSEPQDSNMVIILACVSVAAIFKMADANFQCPISRRIMETET